MPSHLTASDHMAIGDDPVPLKELISAQPLPAEVTVTAGALGGVRTAEITVDVDAAWRFPRWTERGRCPYHRPT
jgi:hypothetical protein